MNVRMIGIVCLLVAMFSAMICMAEEPAINPSRITTPQIVVYGTTLTSTFAGPVTIAGTFTTTGTLASSGALTVAGDATFNGTTATVTNNLVVNKNTTLTGTTLHTGAATFNGGINIGVQAGQTLNVTNKCNGNTNILWFGAGTLTNVTYIGTP
jgi:hypothetical protein